MPDGATYSFAADITLYAQWTAANHTVTFNANGGTGSMSPQTANVPTAADTPANTYAQTDTSLSAPSNAAASACRPAPSLAWNPAYPHVQQ